MIPTTRPIRIAISVIHAIATWILLIGLLIIFLLLVKSYDHLQSCFKDKPIIMNSQKISSYAPDIFNPSKSNLSVVVVVTEYGVS